MLTKYHNEFSEMSKRIRIEGNPLEIIKEYLPKFEGERIGAIGIANYLVEYHRRSD